jgi:transposase InsO family protein
VLLIAKSEASSAIKRI